MCSLRNSLFTSLACSSNDPQRSSCISPTYNIIECDNDFRLSYSAPNELPFLLALLPYHTMDPFHRCEGCRDHYISFLEHPNQTFPNVESIIRLTTSKFATFQKLGNSIALVPSRGMGPVLQTFSLLATRESHLLAVASSCAVSALSVH